MSSADRLSAKIPNGELYRMASDAKGKSVTVLVEPSVTPTQMQFEPTPGFSCPAATRRFVGKHSWGELPRHSVQFPLLKGRPSANHQKRGEVDYPKGKVPVTGVAPIDKMTGERRGYKAPKSHGIWG